MTTPQFAVGAAILACSLLVVGLRTPPARAQGDGQGAAPSVADYAGTDAEGNLQKALDAALAKAQDACSHRDGKVISDLMLDWQLRSVAGVRGGIAGKREVTVTIHVGK